MDQGSTQPINTQTQDLPLGTQQASSTEQVENSAIGQLQEMLQHKPEQNNNNMNQEESKDII